MHRPQPGARFLGRLLRARREALGLTRGQVLRRSRRGPHRPLAPTVLRDLETGDRLPTLSRLPALARALGFHPAELLEWVLLAPVLEEAAGRVAGPAGRGGPLLRAAAGYLAAGRPAEAAVLALRAWPAPGKAGSAPPVLARAVLALGSPLLALLLAGRSRDPGAVLDVQAEALERLGLAGAARRIADGGDPRDRRMAAVRARLLEAADPLRAAGAWAELLDRAREAGDARGAAEAAAGVARCLDRAGRPREAARFLREGERWRPGGPGSLAPPGAGD